MIIRIPICIYEGYLYKEVLEQELGIPDMIESTDAISVDRKAYTLFVDDRRKGTSGEKMHLLIPCLGIDEVVMDGTSKEVLHHGPGLFSSSQMPGEGNRNVSIGAFRYGKYYYENLFHHLHRIRTGDLLYLTYRGYVYCYCYKETMVVNPSDTSVLGVQGYSCLSLISCHPIGQTTERIVVRAELVQISVQTKEYRYLENAKDWQPLVEAILRFSKGADGFENSSILSIRTGKLGRMQRNVSGGDKTMEEMYVRLILKGRRCFAEVPLEVKERVKELLIEIGREDLLDV